MGKDGRDSKWVFCRNKMSCGCLIIKLNLMIWAWQVVCTSHWRLKSRVLAKRCYEDAPLRSGKMPDQTKSQPLFFNNHLLLATLKIGFKSWVCSREQGNLSAGEKRRVGLASIHALNIILSILWSQDTCFEALPDWSALPHDSHFIPHFNTHVLPPQ